MTQRSILIVMTLFVVYLFFSAVMDWRATTRMATMSTYLADQLNEMRTMLHQSIERLQATYDAIDRLDTKQEESKQSIDATKEAVKDLKERSGGGGNAHTGPD